MNQISSSVSFCLDIAKFQTELNRRLDSRLGGIGLNELIVLYQIMQSEGQKIRRIDLAEKIGLTASGVTRLLLPMEKIGLVKREANPHDARVSYVTIAPGGKTKLEEGLERAELFCKELIPADKIKKIEEFSELLKEIGKNI